MERVEQRATRVCEETIATIVQKCYLAVNCEELGLTIITAGEAAPPVRSKNGIVQKGNGGKLRENAKDAVQGRGFNRERLKVDSISERGIAAI
jgi:hypothetical protein